MFCLLLLARTTYKSVSNRWPMWSYYIAGTICVRPTCATSILRNAHASSKSKQLAPENRPCKWDICFCSVWWLRIRVFSLSMHRWCAWRHHRILFHVVRQQLHHRCRQKWTTDHDCVVMCWHCNPVRCSTWTAARPCRFVCFDRRRFRWAVTSDPVWLKPRWPHMPSAPTPNFVDINFPWYCLQLMVQ